MTRHISSLLRLVPAAAIALALSACALGQQGSGTAVQNGVIVDDLRSPSSRNY